MLSERTICAADARGERQFDPASDSLVAADGSKGDFDLMKALRAIRSTNPTPSQASAARPRQTRTSL